ncbi:hypothetical protein ACA910_014842 [Epithemia clementina (nom. ined.)]
MSSSSSDDTTTGVIPGRPTWQQTMLRIKDPQKSLDFYCNKLGFTLIDTLDFPQYEFCLYLVSHLANVEQEPYTLTPGTQAAHDYLWSMEGTALELTHNYGTEHKDGFSYHAGNQEKDGFGHVAVSVEDVYAACAELEAAGCSFKKKPDEGRMKGLAFVYDPDGYWVEIVKRGGNNSGISIPYNFSQTMLRVKDPQKSLHFYRDKMGMKLVRESHYPDAQFSLYFLASSNSPPVHDDDGARNLFQPVLELTHNHGTELDESFRHYNGNEEDRKGFGHLGFLVDDVYKACDALRPLGYGFKKEPDGGSMKGLAFAYDPDGYWVEIIKRGGIDFGDKRKD